MTKEEFEAFFESQCIPADLPFDEIAKRWGTINNNLDTILPSKLYRFRKVKRDEKGKDYMIDSRSKAKLLPLALLHAFLISMTPSAILMRIEFGIL